MKKLLILLCFIVSMLSVKAQLPAGNTFIKDMQWGVDFKIHLTLFNDSSYTINVQDLEHSTTINSDTLSKEFVYYPVMLARDFVDKLKETTSQDLTTNASTPTETNTTPKPMTLWSSLHNSVGGGWVHFVNCLLYSLETRYLSLTAPLMERPKSSWKPNPMTETFKRTRKWKYYVPADMKLAHNEYYQKKKNNQLDNLHDVPAEFIKLFLETNNREYKKIVASKDNVKQARIDLVKLLVGANYLGNTQLTYIKTMVQKSVLQYSYNQLPNVILFDDLEAAVVMSLNEAGYNLERVVFRNEQNLSAEEKDTRLQRIQLTIQSINKANQKIFEERLKKYYK